MVSFCCDHCQEIIKKPKAEMHVRRCYPASLSCVDCYKTFTGNAFKAHTSCITEEQKFHGKLYKDNKGNNNGKQQQQKQQQQQHASKPTPASASAPAPAPASITPAASPSPAPTSAPAEPKKRTASAAANSASSDSSSSSSESESDSEPAKKKAKTAAATSGPSGEDVKRAIGTLGEVSKVTYKELVKRTIKTVRKAHPSVDKAKAKKLVKEHIRFNVVGGKVMLA